MELTTDFKGDLRVVGFGGLGAAFGRVHDCGGVEERETRRKEGRTSHQGKVRRSPGLDDRLGERRIFT